MTATPEKKNVQVRDEGGWKLAACRSPKTHGEKRKRGRDLFRRTASKMTRIGPPTPYEKERKRKKLTVLPGRGRCSRGRGSAEEKTVSVKRGVSKKPLSCCARKETSPKVTRKSPRVVRETEGKQGKKGGEGLERRRSRRRKRRPSPLVPGGIMFL